MKIYCNYAVVLKMITFNVETTSRGIMTYEEQKLHKVKYTGKLSLNKKIKPVSNETMLK